MAFTALVVGVLTLTACGGNSAAPAKQQLRLAASTRAAMNTALGQVRGRIENVVNASTPAPRRPASCW